MSCLGPLQNSNVNQCHRTQENDMTVNIMHISTFIFCNNILDCGGHVCDKYVYISMFNVRKSFLVIAFYIQKQNSVASWRHEGFKVCQNVRTSDSKMANVKQMGY